MTRSQDRRQDALRVVAPYLLICEGLAILTRLILKKIIIGARGVDDAVAVIALIFSIISGITATLAGAEGLGNPNLETVSESRIQRLQQFIYVSEIFHVLCQCLIRVSMLLFIRRIFTSRTKSSSFNFGIILVIIWGLVSTLVVIFQCDAPETWNLANGSCLNVGLFWVFFNAIEIIIDMIIILLPTWLSWNLNMSLRRKLTVFTYFAPWLSTIAVAATSIGYAHEFSKTNKAVPITIGVAIWPWFLCAQILRALSIISTCIPYLRPLIEAFPSGLYQTDEIRRRGLNYTDYKHGFAVSGGSNTGNPMYHLRDSNNTSSK